jgi:hypothetical protein
MRVLQSFSFFICGRTEIPPDRNQAYRIAGTLPAGY